MNKTELLVIFPDPTGIVLMTLSSLCEIKQNKNTEEKAFRV